jgi:hypothetical protein
MIKFLLILTFLRAGQPITTAYGYAERQECLNSTLSLVESGIESGHVILHAECYPVAPSWDLRL